MVGGWLTKLIMAYHLLCYRIQRMKTEVVASHPFHGTGTNPGSASDSSKKTISKLDKSKLVYCQVCIRLFNLKWAYVAITKYYTSLPLSLSLAPYGV